MADVATTDGAEALSWHVLLTKPRAEWMVHRLLTRAGFANLYPHEHRLVSLRGRKIACKAPLYPRILFVGLLPGQGCWTIAHMPGVADFLRDSGGPKRVRPEAIAQERERCDPTGLVRRGPAVPINEEPWVVKAIAAGARFRITAGTFEGYWGKLTDVDKHGGAVVEVALFGRATPLHLPLDWLDTVRPELRSERRISLTA